MRRDTVATAESCTGGLVATLLTELSGSSAYYLGGVSAYANATKIGLLGVEPKLIDAYGAVSGSVAEAMARGAQQRLGSVYAIALTGVAGPDGGSADKPVGTVYCGIAGKRAVRHVRFLFPGDRDQVRRAAAYEALRELAWEINN